MAGPAYSLQQPRSLEEAEGLGRGQEAVVCGLRVTASDETPPPSGSIEHWRCCTGEALARAEASGTSRCPA
jgi:hypothetical protein